MRIVYLVLAFIPFVAGMLAADVMGTAIDWWRIPQAHPHHFATPQPVTSSSEFLLMLFAAIACHAATWLLRNFATHRPTTLNLGPTAWRILIRCGYLVGFIAGIWIWLTE